MTFHLKGLLVSLAFFSAVLLALDFRLGLTTCLLAVVAYVIIESSSMGIWLGVWERMRSPRQHR